MLVKWALELAKWPTDVTKYWQITGFGKYWIMHNYIHKLPFSHLPQQKYARLYSYYLKLIL